MSDVGAGRGQYDAEYRICPCFWGRNPAKYVKLLPTWLGPQHRTAIDLGAGEGKNAFYLRELGLAVHAVEVSRYAVRNFVDRMISEDVDDIELTLGDAIRITDGNTVSVDVVVAYGLLHCLHSTSEASHLVQQMQRITNPGGLNVVSAFADRLPVPPEQAYLSPLLMPEGEVRTWYEETGEWEVLAYEDDTLTESHPTSRTEHQHSLFRLAARKIG